MDTTKPTVLITGGAKRIGAALARTFAHAGWHVVIHFRSSGAEAETLAASLPSAQSVQCDLADDEAAIQMVNTLAQELPNWRCLINCAGVFVPDDVTGLDPQTNRSAMQINALSPVRMAQKYFERARTNEGGRCVINVTDQKLENPNPDFFSYTMSKHAIASTIPMISMAHSHEHDRIYGLAPGAILASHDQSEDETETSHRLNLLGRKTGADEIGDAALFLTSGTLASGQSLLVDSGQHLLHQGRDVIYLARETAA
jgi:NAD(P)-dependent dehydrogenase (short-subunit alcohol dehydrogenase family)